MTLAEYIKNLETMYNVNRSKIRCVAYTESELLVAECELLRDVIANLKKIERNEAHES